jgi:hypothetical protein
MTLLKIDQRTLWVLTIISALCAVGASGLGGCDDSAVNPPGMTAAADTQPTTPEDTSTSGVTDPTAQDASTTEADAHTHDDSHTHDDTTGTVDEDGVTLPGPDRATLVHGFGEVTLAPFEESQPCISWTLNNEQALYVQRIRIANEGGFHHSNWYIVPDDQFPGEDGFWDCDSRGFSDLDAMLSGASVLYAQSTQALFEEQGLGEGIVVKIPPRQKLIAGGHMLNLSSRDLTTSMRMGLEVIHPRLVQDVVVPFRFSYDALRIHPNSETRLTGECEVGTALNPEGLLNLKLYWLLPHYHNLGNFFSVDVMGGAKDGERLFELSGFNAEPNGKTFNPPVDLTDARGLRFTCGFNNASDRFVGWGIGDQEMCMMLGFASGSYMFDATVRERAYLGQDAQGMHQYGGPCGVLLIPTGLRRLNFSMPTDAEKAAPLNPPASDGTDLDAVFNACVDTPQTALGEAAPTLSSLKMKLFTPSCTFSACHSGARPSAGLDLTGDGLHARLLAHAPVAATDQALVAPGAPQASWLYTVLSQCEPHTLDGDHYPHMPYNSPTLLEPALIATVRDWIAAGALDD